MIEATTQNLAVNDVDLAWWERGESWADHRTLVLLHGFTGSAHDFALVVDDLTDRRVVLVDQRGHGYSTKTGTVDGYTIDQLVEDLAAFLDAVGHGPVDLLGHSMGGRVVMSLALRRPDLVGSLVLMDTTAWSFVPPDEEIRALLKDWITAFDPARGMPEGGRLMPPGPEDALIEAAVPAPWQTEKDALFTAMDPYAVKALGTALLAEMNAHETSLRGELPSITCPTTVIAGEHDHPLVDQAPELAGLVADGRLAVIEGAFHSPQLTHPEQWKNEVRAHLDRADAERAAS